ncbi:hypothetical protein LCGC14_1864480 [marine sediment metagenome]|uniref:Uncharacterized protein n=1 Tax=marine sediment metagenome TaxID=412755 RepID=A0A0F9J5H9_9ZZZZ
MTNLERLEKMKNRSALGEHRPDYVFVCGICGRVIKGKSNTVHLGIGSHLAMEYRQGKRDGPYSGPRKYGDSSRKGVL